VRGEKRECIARSLRAKILKGGCGGLDEHKLRKEKSEKKSGMYMENQRGEVGVVSEATASALKQRRGRLQASVKS